MTDSPESNGDAAFTDLRQDWYCDAVDWAFEKEIISGYGGGNSAPRTPWRVSRRR